MSRQPSRHGEQDLVSGMQMIEGAAESESVKETILCLKGGGGGTEEGRIGPVSLTEAIDEHLYIDQQLVEERLMALDLHIDQTQNPLQSLRLQSSSCVRRLARRRRPQ
ncbi:hypothetical protein PGTUg99_019075 [Puccinia graminis f. sp. tritici]|uniref:Uncharacterized protein n=1 Tax=Puccinia graminis f. sp. tritici TaxID=56615 RepID=A0A5B0RFH7_PUCGR|nr:hypothetical protein PGTUg99_019075 [Puccinia graminis f. sp. tritici]